MSTTTPAVQESGESYLNQTRVGEMVVVKVRDDVYNIANYEHGADEAKRHTYSVSATAGCTCPAAKYHRGPCKHEEAVATVEAREERDAREAERVTGPHNASAPGDAPGDVDYYTYWRCEECGGEATDKRALEDCCQYFA